MNGLCFDLYVLSCPFYDVWNLERLEHHGNLGCPAGLALSCLLHRRQLSNTVRQS